MREVSVDYEETPLIIDVEIMVDKINRQKVAFWHPHSRLVDYRLIEKFLEQTYPNTKVRTSPIGFRRVVELILN